MRTLFRRNAWWIKRIGMLPIHLLVFVIGTFFLVRAIPGDPVLAHLGETWSQADYDLMQQRLGLDGSLPEQLGRYLLGIVQLDLGQSITSGRPVLEEIAARYPATLELALMSLSCTILVSLTLSYFVVMHPSNVFARVVREYSRAAGAIPEYVLAVAGLYLFYVILRWAPAPLGRFGPTMSQPEPITGMPVLDSVLQGRWDAVGAAFAHLAIPIGVMTIAHSALLVKMLSTSLEQSLAAPPTLFRVATGARPRTVVASIYRRAFPPALITCGGLFGFLTGGAVVIEGLFGFSGMGQYAVDAVGKNDYIALQGILVVIATSTLLVFLLVDIGNMFLDPRRRPGTRVEE